VCVVIAAQVDVWGVEGHFPAAGLPHASGARPNRPRPAAGGKAGAAAGVCVCLLLLGQSDL